MDKGFEARYNRAVAEAKISDQSEPRAKSARYDVRSGRVRVELENETTFIFPVGLVEGLAGAEATSLKDVSVTPAGDGLRWDDLDIDLSLTGLMMGVFGGRRWMSELGRIGGKASSAAKTNAAKINGRLGGRPKRKTS